jgi:predicted metal-binding protein
MDDSATVNQVGKRYRCEACATEIMCVKSGSGRFHCHAVPMELLTAKPLPSSD